MNKCKCYRKYYYILIKCDLVCCDFHYTLDIDASGDNTLLSYQFTNKGYCSLCYKPFLLDEEFTALERIISYSLTPKEDCYKYLNTINFSNTTIDMLLNGC